ncbi:MAG: lipocalin family protein [Phycisphaerales bacterium]|nr:MAG: lipocalin family protein [Phycisphaerales bacterium]
MNGLNNSLITKGVVAVAFALGLAGGCGAFYPPLSVVEMVDLDRYAGRWYEIARYPNSFERGCVGVTADYTPRDDGRIEVVNTCFESSLEGPERVIRGSARVADATTNAKLKVRFFWLFEGDYWIIDLDEDYSYAVVGEPRRNFLWILSRTPQMDEDTYTDIVESLPAFGYDPGRLILVLQPEETD